MLKFISATNDSSIAQNIATTHANTNSVDVNSGESYVIERAKSDIDNEEKEELAASIDWTLG